MMHPLFDSDLSTEGKLLKRYFDDRLLQLEQRMEHRMAFQNKVEAQKYLKPHEASVFDTKLRASHSVHEELAEK